MTHEKEPKKKYSKPVLAIIDLVGNEILSSCKTPAPNGSMGDSACRVQTCKTQSTI
ncbi:MAG: hypothetical protein KKD44_22680 [Proteobacteria bacterium]|nr:hypothetical protein [Pseudomonadota bacterium]